MPVSVSTNIFQNILGNLFPQVAETEQTIANLVVVVAAWGLVVALELVLVIWLLARRR